MATRKSQRGNWGQPPWKILFHARAQELPKHTDFAIVGGGFAGLAAAAWLRRLAPEKSVLLLEAGRVGSGASGRTGGMVLAATAAGDLPGLGDVLKGYRRILREFEVRSDLSLSGIWEIARGRRSMEGKAIRPLRNSPIDWGDSGRVRAVGRVPGGTLDPGKTVTALARAAAKRGAQLVEGAEVLRIEPGSSARLLVRWRSKGRWRKRKVIAQQVLLVTNAGGLRLTKEAKGGKDHGQPKLTFALATAPLRKKQIAAIGMRSLRPFYTVDLPYLWGRTLKNGGMIFGSGLLPGFGESLGGESGVSGKELWGGLERFDVSKEEAAERLRVLEKRVRGLHPALKNVEITHRWGGPILITQDFVPVFRRHPGNRKVIVLGGFSGHGVALSVYLGKWAAEVLVGRRELPAWGRR